VVATALVSYDLTINAPGTCTVLTVLPIAFGVVTSTSGTVDAKTAPQSLLQVSCGQGIAWTLTLSDGNNVSGSGATRRRMANGSSFLAYGIYSGSSGTTDFTNATGTGTGFHSDVLLFGYLPAQSGAGLVTGMYRDVLIATVSY
jgi:spore coat protein U-like protein